MVDEKTIQCPMDIVVYSLEEVAYWQQAPASLVASVLREGKVLYERDSFQTGIG